MAEIAAAKCPSCGEVVADRHLIVGGRPRLYCDEACKRKVEKARRWRNRQLKWARRILGLTPSAQALYARAYGEKWLADKQGAARLLLEAESLGR